MNKELSDFAARLRETISVGDDVRRLMLQTLNSGLRTPNVSEPPYVGSYDDVFNQFALELFTLQFQYNAAYRKICEARHWTPERVEHWTQIPAAPTAAFKELELSCIPPEERTAVFHSSGTTGQKPSRHFHCAESLALYEASLWSWFARHVVPEFGVRSSESRVLILTPPPGQAQHSSLIHMFETIRQQLGRQFGVPPSGGRVNAELQTLETVKPAAFFGRATADGSWILDFDDVLTALRSSLVTRHSSLLLGTAFSFVHLLDFLSEHELRFQLPEGSRVMETGGYKNHSRTMPKAELHTLITERLGVPPENIICEYGMSELSSQAYALGAPASRRQARLFHSQKHAGETPALPGRFHFPPWSRSQIISPETGREVADGETGLIRIYDLANIFSVMAVQTEDLGIRQGDGFELLGRAQMAELRGCSLMSA